MDKKQFLKLKQLDRIEYLLLKKILDDNYSFSFVSFIGSLIYPMLWYSLFMILLFKFFNNMQLFYLFPILTYIIKWTIVIGVGIKIVLIYLYHKNKDELEERFVK